MVNTLIPSLKRQTNQNFTWGIINNNPKQQKIIQSHYNKPITFFNSGSEAKTYSRDNGYNLQTRQDSDDIICDDYIKIIQDQVTKSNKDILLIQFQPTKLHYKSKKEYHTFRYSNKFMSMFLSLYQKDIKYDIHDRTHPKMYTITPNIITIPEGCVNLVIHDDNLTTKMESYDRLMIKKVRTPEQNQTILKISSLVKTVRKVVR